VANSVLDAPVDTVLDAAGHRARCLVQLLMQREGGSAKVFNRPLVVFTGPRQVVVLRGVKLFLPPSVRNVGCTATALA
jgi:hypothetical protein